MWANQGGFEGFGDLSGDLERFVEGSGDFVGAESGAGGEGHEGFCILPCRR